VRNTPRSARGVGEIGQWFSASIVGRIAQCGQTYRVGLVDPFQETDACSRARVGDLRSAVERAAISAIASGR